MERYLVEAAKTHKLTRRLPDTSLTLSFCCFSTHYSAGIYLMLRTYLSIPPQTPVIHGDMNCRVSPDIHPETQASSEKLFLLLNINPSLFVVGGSLPHPPVRLPHPRPHPWGRHQRVQVRPQNQVSSRQCHALKPEAHVTVSQGVHPDRQGQPAVAPGLLPHREERDHRAHGHPGGQVHL